MKYLTAILILCTSLYSQDSPTIWWSQADSSQKAFAAKCYEFGKQYGRGHTLAAIGWMESSLGKDLEHEEVSYGPFGISGYNCKIYRTSKTLEQSDVEVESIYSDFEQGARIAIIIFEDNIRYFRRLGYSEREAYFWAYPRYNAGKNWRNFKGRGEVFRQRVNFLMKEFK